MSIFGIFVDLFWLGFAGLIVLGLIYLIYSQGWFGVATRARGLIIIDSLQKRVDSLNEQIDKWQARVAAQEAAKSLSAPAPVSTVQPVPIVIIARDKAWRDERLAEAAARLAAGTLTQPQYDAVVLKISTE